MNILTLNSWSHSIKYHLFSQSGAVLLAVGTVERVGLGSSFISQRTVGRKPFYSKTEFIEHQGAVDLIMSTLTSPLHGVIADITEISAVGHRVAHGGEEFQHSVKIDEHVLESIRKLHHLAPLHCAPNIAGIEAAMMRLPDVLHVAIFDTAFHRSMPECAYLYPLPYEWYENHGVRRYGFHGPSHLYLSKRAAVHLGKPAEVCNLITIHLDKGVSLCAIKNGISIDTSMGMTPLEGAVMETRCGDIDSGIQSYMMQKLDLSAREMEQVLNQKSGILGLTGLRPGRQHFLGAVLDGDPRCKMALELETYRLRKYIGSYLAAIGPLDGIVFTAGTSVAEWFVREMVLDGLECFGVQFERGDNRAVVPRQEEVEITANGSSTRIFVIPTNEELVYVEDVAAIYSGVNCDHRNHDYTFARSDFTHFGMKI